MTKPSYRRTALHACAHIFFSACVLQLAGCASTDATDSANLTTPQPALSAPVAAPVVSTPTAAEVAASNALKSGIDLYDRGSYSAAIKRLRNAPEIWAADKNTQTQALKYMAFSYCVTSRKKLCKLEFQKALKLDPTFELAPGEQGHPLWGPVFEQAKRSQPTVH